MIPPEVLTHLRDPALVPVWARLRDRLERNGLIVHGRTVVDLDEAAADRLGGILGRRVQPGRRSLDVAAVDTDLRSSAAACGLPDVLTELGGPLVDRTARRRHRWNEWDAIWHEFSRAVAEPWVHEFIGSMRSGPSVARLGPDRAREVLGHLAALLRRLDGVPAGRAALAAEITGDAHGLDDGRTLNALALRALAARDGLGFPTTPLARRELWSSLGVTSDDVSGTALVWNLAPPGASPWSRMVGARRDLGLVTHLTSLELAQNSDRLVSRNTVVWACENPQVLQAAVAHGVTELVICASGNPSTAWWALFQRLLADGADVRYHGDFDWPGVRIAARVLAEGATPWRFGADEYLAAPGRLPLTGTPVETPWDPRLVSAMLDRGVAVHEESLEAVLLSDLS